MIGEQSERIQALERDLEDVQADLERSMLDAKQKEVEVEAQASRISVLEHDIRQYEAATFNFHGFLKQTFSAEQVAKIERGNFSDVSPDMR